MATMFDYPETMSKMTVEEVIELIVKISKYCAERQQSADTPSVVKD